MAKAAGRLQTQKRHAERLKRECLTLCQCFFRPTVCYGTIVVQNLVFAAAAAAAAAVVCDETPANEPLLASP